MIEDDFQRCPDCGMMVRRGLMSWVNHSRNECDFSLTEEKKYTKKSDSLVLFCGTALMSEYEKLLRKLWYESGEKNTDDEYKEAKDN